MGFGGKVFKSVTKAVSSVGKIGENIVRGIKENPLQTAAIIAAGVATGGAAGLAMAGAGAYSAERAGSEASKTRQAEKAYNQQVAAAEASAKEANRAELLSLKRNYSKRTTPSVSMGGTGRAVSDESVGGITLG